MHKILRLTIALLLMAWLTGTMQARQSYTLVIDAGHGGHDSGAKGAFSKEKDINLKVALAFGSMVEQHCPDVKVIYTRKTDVFVPLIRRAEIANKNHADVFISIHTNAIAGRKQLRGLETYTMGLRRSDEKLSAAQRENDVILLEKDYQQHYAGYDPRSPESQIMFEFINDQNMEESVRLAKMIQQCVCSTAGRPDKGVKQDAFLVLRETSMPACLVELGYITTPAEERSLNDKANITAIGKGLYQAFRQYKEKRPVALPKDSTPQPEAGEPDQAGAKAPAAPIADTDTAPATVDKEQADTEGQPRQKPAATTGQTDPRPVFKVQISMSDRRLRENHPSFKGLKGIQCYREGKTYKYTCGESTDYQEMLRLRRKLAKQFPQAFIVAFTDGQRMELDKAIRLWRAKRD